MVNCLLIYDKKWSSTITESNSSCKFSIMNKKPRSKKFMSTESLYYEEERLNTFIDWPIDFITPEDLASCGFYYLRTKDHCACAFCLGVIGAWERGDTPMGEHKKHFPTCPFINGYPTPNVPLLHGNILARLNKGSLDIQPQTDAYESKAPIGFDVCGTGKEFPTEIGTNSDIPLGYLGLPMYSGPKRKEFVTYESRLATFKEWPEKVKATPEQLADAGFFYIGLSDHVRCFHCGNGLRNWEPNDAPWEEHARWYPDCNYVILKKGNEFIDEIRRTNPPYVHTPPNQPSVYVAKGAKYNKFSISDDEMNRLMDLQVNKAAVEMGFSPECIKVVLKKKLEQTGVPFFALEHLVDAIFKLNSNEEHSDHQARKLNNFSGSSQSQPSSDSSNSQNQGNNSSVIIPQQPSNSSNSFRAVAESIPAILPQPPPVSVESQRTTDIPECDVSMPALPPRQSTPEIAETSSVISTISLPELPRRCRPSTSFENVTPVLPVVNLELQRNSNSPPFTNSTRINVDEPMDETEEYVVVSTLPESTLPLRTTHPESTFALRTTHPESTFPPQESNANNETIEENLSRNSSEEVEIVESSVEETQTSGYVSSSVSSIPSDVPPLRASTPHSEVVEAVVSTELSKTEKLNESTSSNELKDPIAQADQVLKEAALALSKDSMSSSGNSSLESLQDVQNKHTKSLTEADNERLMCRVCMDHDMEVVFLPCSHMLACASCATTLSTCPICRRGINYAIKAIIS